jgi:uncharacterized OB-fold protein
MKNKDRVLFRKNNLEIDLKEYFFPIKCPSCGTPDHDIQEYCEICGSRKRFSEE